MLLGLTALWQPAAESLHTGWQLSSSSSSAAVGTAYLMFFSRIAGSCVADYSSSRTQQHHCQHICKVNNAATLLQAVVIAALGEKGGFAAGVWDISTSGLAGE